LKNTLLLLPIDVVYANVELLFWIVCLGVIVAKEPAKRDWFVRQTARFAAHTRLETNEEQYKMVLDKYLFLDSGQGVQITKIVLTVSEMERVGLEVEDLDLVSPAMWNLETKTSPEIMFPDSASPKSLRSERTSPSQVKTTTIPYRINLGGVVL
jgi:hypothetical protein